MGKGQRIKKKRIKQLAEQLAQTVTESYPVDQAQQENPLPPTAVKQPAATFEPEPQADFTPPRKRGLVLRGATKLRQKIFGSRAATQDEAQFRKTAVQVQSQAKFTETLINSSREVLVEKGKTDDKLRQALDKFDKGMNRRAALDEKLRSGEEVTADEFRELVGGLSDVSGVLKDSGIALTVDFPKVISQFQTMINDNRLDLGFRRDLISGLKTTIKASGASTENTKALLKINEQQFNATTEEQSTLNALLNKVSDDTKDVKFSATVGNLEKDLDSLVLTNDELRDFLERKDSKRAMDKGIGGVSPDLKKGLLSSLFSVMGLGGLENVVEGISGRDLLDTFGGGKDKGFGGGAKAGKGSGRMGKVFGKVGGLFKGATGGIGRGVGGLLGKVGGLGGSIVGGMGGMMGGLGGMLKGGGKLLGKLALPLAALMSAIDFGSGYSNAGEISGKGDKATTGDKIQSGVASVVEGLTFGLVGAKDAFKGIDAGIEFLVGKDGILTKAGAFFSDIIDKVGAMIDFPALFEKLGKGFEFLFGPKGVFSGAGNLISKIPGFGNLFGGPTPATAGTTSGTVGLPGNALDGSAMSLSRKNAADERDYRNKVVENTGKPNTVIVAPPVKTGSTQPNRTAHIDDLGLAVMNMNSLD